MTLSSFVPNAFSEAMLLGPAGFRLALGFEALPSLTLEQCQNCSALLSNLDQTLTEEGATGPSIQKELAAMRAQEESDSEEMDPSEMVLRFRKISRGLLRVPEEIFQKAVGATASRMNLLLPPGIVSPPEEGEKFREMAARFQTFDQRKQEYLKAGNKMLQGVGILLPSDYEAIEVRAALEGLRVYGWLPPGLYQGMIISALMDGGKGRRKTYLDFIKDHLDEFTDLPAAMFQVAIWEREELDLGVEAVRILADHLKRVAARITESAQKTMRELTVSGELARLREEQEAPQGEKDGLLIKMIEEQLQLEEYLKLLRTNAEGRQIRHEAGHRLEDSVENLCNQDALLKVAVFGFDVAARLTAVQILKDQGQPSRLFSAIATGDGLGWGWAEYRNDQVIEAAKRVMGELEKGGMSDAH